MGYGWQLHRERRRRVAPRSQRHRDLVRPAAPELHVRHHEADRRQLWPGPPGNGRRLSGEIRLGICSLCLDLSPATAAEAVDLFSGIARRSIVCLFHRPDAGERLSEGNRAEAEPGEYALMPRFSSKLPVHHTASQMFDLVADVERYPEFVPLCQSLKIRQRTRNPDGTEIIVADMTVSFKLVRETFTSRVTLDRANLKILVEYLKGPFSNLENRWTFEARREHACDVSFFISYEFKSRMLAILMGSMFDAAFQRLASAFEKQADVIYGKG